MGVRSSLDDLRRGEIERLLEERRKTNPWELSSLTDLGLRKCLSILIGLRSEGKVHGPDNNGVWHWQ